MAPRKILALKLRSLGDTVLMTAALQEVRRAYPNAEIHVATLAPWAPLLEKQPYADRVWSYEKHRHTPSRAKALARLAFRLRRERFDCVLNFHASPSSATLAFATGAPIRSIHFHGHRDRNRYSTVVIPGKGIIKPIIERDMDTVRALGIQAPIGALPQLSLDGPARAQARNRLASKGLHGPLLGLGLGSSRNTKCWPLAKFAELAVSWASQSGGAVLALANPTEIHRLEEFQRETDRRLNAFVSDEATRADLRRRIQAEADLDIASLASVLAELSVFCGNDSGPRHLAVAVGTPTVTLFGPEHPFEWHPYPIDRHPYFFVDGLSCRRDADPGMPAWCALNDCVEEKHRCMQQIEASGVLEQCLRLGLPASSETPR